MANVFKLDDIRSEAEARYAPVEVETPGGLVKLRSILRLGEKDRAKVLAAIEEINSTDDEEDEDFKLELVIDSVAQVIKLIADKPKRLLNELEHEDPVVKAHMHTQVLSAWMGGTQLGEAESSPS